MIIKQSADLLQEMEELRKELYISATNHSYLLTTGDIYQASVKLDKAIVQYLREKYCTNTH